MRRLVTVSLLCLLWSGHALAAATPAVLRLAQAPVQTPWPPTAPQRHLPPTGFVTPEDRPEEEDLSPGEAARQAQQMNGGGRVLSVEQAHDGWRVKLIKNGDVRIVFVPD